METKEELVSSNPRPNSVFCVLTAGTLLSPRPVHALFFTKPLNVDLNVTKQTWRISTTPAHGSHRHRPPVTSLRNLSCVLCAPALRPLSCVGGVSSGWEGEPWCRHALQSQAGGRCVPEAKVARPGGDPRPSCQCSGRTRIPPETPQWQFIAAVPPSEPPLPMSPPREPRHGYQHDDGGF